MTNTPPKLPLPGDPLYRAILIVLVLNVVLGAGLALFGDLRLNDPTTKSVGISLALISGTLYYLLRFLGRRAARKRSPRTEGKGAGARGDDEIRP